MKKVLWVSRHPLSREQKEGLASYCGEPPEILWHQKTVEEPDVLLPAIQQADVIAAVLPLHLLAWVVSMGKPVLISRAIRVLSPGPKASLEVCFTHGGWYRIDKLEIVLTPAEK